jgi:catechol 2,3-dioxygenase-like lactoylglutathione lyase family enzyme
MKASVYHVQLNVRDAGVHPGVLGMSNGTTDVWLIGTPADPRRHAPHRKNPGLNHIAWRVTSRADVDRLHEEFLKSRGIPALYGGPREYPEYRRGYYAVFFEDPDRLKLEVVHIP